MDPTGSSAVLEAYRKLFLLVVNITRRDERNASWIPLFEWSRRLHEMCVCSVCDLMVINPHRIKSLNCKHTVCKNCIVAGMTGICRSCVPEAAYVIQYDLLQIVMIGYIGLCTYIRAAPFFRDTALDNITDDKLYFMARVTEASIHEEGLPSTNQVSNGTSNSPTHVNCGLTPIGNSTESSERDPELNNRIQEKIAELCVYQSLTRPRTVYKILSSFFCTVKDFNTFLSRSVFCEMNPENGDSIVNSEN